MSDNTNVSAIDKTAVGWVSLLPFGVFLIFYLGLSIWSGDFYATPMPVAFLVASASAMLIKRRELLADKVEIFVRGMGDGNIMIMCLIFILAGAFAAVARAAGAVDSTVLICRHLIPVELMLGGFFIISCLISLAIGTSCGTIAAVMPIAAGLTGQMNISPALMTGAVIGGAMFGDNMSMISDTTIAATRSMQVKMRDKFLTNFKMVLPVAILTVLIYIVSGRNAPAAILPPAAVGWKDVFAMLPYIVVLIGAVCGFNVMVLLFAGTVLSLLIGVLTGNLTLTAGLSESGKGILSMTETLIVALLAGGLLNMIRHYGGITYLLRKIGYAISGRTGCEYGIMLLVSAVNLFTANNTVAIVVAGPIAKTLSDKYDCDPRRAASILDAASCVVQGIIPYGAQILIAMGILNSVGIKITSLELISCLYYPWLLGAALIIAIGVNGFISRRK